MRGGVFVRVLLITDGKLLERFTLFFRGVVGTHMLVKLLSHVIS